MSEETKKDWKKIRESFEEEENESLENEFEDTEVASDKAALDHPSYLALEEKLTLAEQKAHENWEKSVRAVAELENVRRRAERDIADAHRYGKKKIMEALIPVLDSLDQALQLANQQAEGAMAEGLQLTLKLFLDVLIKQDVSEINPQGEPFNPEEHEAMSIQATNDVAPNTVVMVFQKGYKLHDRVIRPARVIVSKAIA